MDFQHVKPGKGGAFVRTRLKHLRLGPGRRRTFRSGEKVSLVDFEEQPMQFLYKDDRFNFMDSETYEQISLAAREVGDAREFLKENIEVDVLTSTASRPRSSCRTSSSWPSRGPTPVCGVTPPQAATSPPRWRPAPW